MSHSNQIQYNFFRLLKLLFASSPLLLFLIYLHVQDKITGQELFTFSILLTLPIAIIILHFQRKLAFLDRKTTLQIHDSKATKDSQMLLMNIMEKLSDPLLILDSNHKILMANKSSHKLLGMQILKQDISIFIRNNVLEMAMKRAHKTGNPESCEFEFGKPVAKHYLARIHKFDLENTQSEHTFEEELSENGTSNKTTTKQYMFVALYDVSAMKHTDKMRADFVANASHELRTPLASIIGFVETLQGPAHNDEQARERFLKIMHDEANRMSRLIEDLLSLSRIERDVHIPPSEKVNLCQLIKSVIDSLEPQAKDKCMHINFSSDALEQFAGDHDQLTQVFQNLIENAIKYGREETMVDVNVSLEDIPQSSLPIKNAVITVSNEGPGIPAEHLPRLMERFYRVDSARSRSLGGTGLGLAIVKHIVQRHRGRIFFESEINATTKVTVSLPTHSPPLETLS